MSFAHPLVLLLLLAAIAVSIGAALIWRQRRRALIAWSQPALWPQLLAGFHPRRIRLSVLGLGLALGGCVLALAQPRWGTSDQVIEREGIDIVFVLDASLSMAASDVLPSRLFAAKELVRRLAAALPAHRVALVGAGGDGVVLSPLTSDTAVLDLILDGLQAGTLAPGTALAPALERGLRLFPEGDEKYRAMVVLSDGEDHQGGLSAISRRLAEAEVEVHVFGIGGLEGATLPDLQHPGAWKRDRDGEVVISRLNEADLEALASATGGRYQRVTSSAFDPAPIAERLDSREGRALGEERISAGGERFQWPLGLAILALVLHLGWPVFDRARRLP